MLQTEKKLVHIFKIFVQKALIPQIKKAQGSLHQWNKFSSILLAQNLNINDLQMYVDSLSNWTISSSDKLQLPYKKTDGQNNDNQAFNPSKTFGGERNKLNIFPYGQDKSDTLDSKRQSQRDQSLRQRVSQNSSNIYSNLQKLVKSLQQNQNLLENWNIKENSIQSSTRINRQAVFQQSSHQNMSGNGFSSHSYNYIPQSQPPSQHMIVQHSHSYSHSQPHSNQPMVMPLNQQAPFLKGHH